MATVNLGIKYEKKIQQKFTQKSLLQGRLENDLDFVGARTVRVHTIRPVPINDYDRDASANRYGTPEEVGDCLQELTMTQDKSFTGIIDKGNSVDQAINKAGKFLKVQLEEELVPYKDQYAFSVLAHKAGVIVGATAAITADNVIARLNAGREAMVNSRVPVAGRTIWVRPALFSALVDTKQFISLEKLGGQALVNGQIGKLFKSPVVEVPDDLMPAGVNFIYGHKSAGSSPAKIADTKMHTDPPGISGNLVEGRFYWDTFVFGAKANGIYVDVTTGKGVEVLAPVKIDAATGGITAVSNGATVWYTTDGSDPRYSTTRQQGNASTDEAGTVVRAYQQAKGKFPSAVTSVTITG